MAKKLNLKKETLSEVSAADLRAVVGAAPGSNTCVSVICKNIEIDCPDVVGSICCNQNTR